MAPQRTYNLVTPAIPTPVQGSAWGAGTSPARVWPDSQAAALRAAARLREALAPPGGLDGGGRAAIHLLHPISQESLLDAPQAFLEASQASVLMPPIHCQMATKV